MTWAVLVAGCLLLAVTALSLLSVDNRFVRAWDFPRAQVAVLLAGVLLASLIVLGVHRWWVLLLQGLLALALGYQLYRIYPYTPLHAVQALPAEAGAAACAADKLRLLVANVRQSNRTSAPLLREIGSADPDLILLLETDEWWAEQLAPLRTAYADVVAQPQDDGYGLFLFSRLPLIEPRVLFRLEDYVPSIETGVRLRSGAVVAFFGVHPKPPPLHDTEKRNAELLLVGQRVRADARPSIVAGDLNDVAWSDTTRLFQQISGLLDPRVGRGLYSTYNANWRIMRWPIDHVFFERSFRLLDIRRLGHIGSDHFPFYIELCHRPEAAGEQAEPSPGQRELQRARETIEDGRERSRSPD